MAPHKDPVFETWWPLPRSMELVRAPLERVAEFVSSELKRIVPTETCESEWRSFDSIDAVFRSIETLTNFPTVFLALPTKTEWTPVWSNSFLCDGYDSLCHNLSRLHGVDTIHWSSSDTDGPMQAATSFAFRRGGEDGARTRLVQVSRDGSAWTFHQSGEPLRGEPIAAYSNRIKRKRLNERLLMEFFATLGAAPWREAFYDVPNAKSFRLWRPSFPDTIKSRPTAQVVTGVKR